MWWALVSLTEVTCKLWTPLSISCSKHKCTNVESLKYNCWTYVFCALHLYVFLVFTDPLPIAALPLGSVISSRESVGDFIYPLYLTKRCLFSPWLWWKNWEKSDSEDRVTEISGTGNNQLYFIISSLEQYLEVFFIKQNFLWQKGGKPMFLVFMYCMITPLHQIENKLQWKDSPLSFPGLEIESRPWLINRV